MTGTPSRAGATRLAPRATALPGAKSTPSQWPRPAVPTYTPKTPAPTPGFPKPATAALRQKSHVRKVMNHTSSSGGGLGWVITAVVVFVAIVFILVQSPSTDTKRATDPAPDAIPEPRLPEGISPRESVPVARPKVRENAGPATRIPEAADPATFLNPLDLESDAASGSDSDGSIPRDSRRIRSGNLRQTGRQREP